MPSLPNIRMKRTPGTLLKGGQARPMAALLGVGLSVSDSVASPSGLCNFGKDVHVIYVPTVNASAPVNSEIEAQLNCVARIGELK